jgi:Cu/Ag efflux pump CusA
MAWATYTPLNVSSMMGCGLPVGLMLTTIATLVGMAPLALGIGAGTDVPRPLAMVVLGGIGVSKFLNLVALPSLAVLCGLGEGKTAPKA